MNNIYFDNAATTIIKPKEVAEAVFNTISSGEFSNPARGFYPFSLNALGIMLDARNEVAKLFQIKDPMKVVFTENITAALNIAIKAFLNPRKHVITTVNEHNSVLRPLYDFVQDISYVGMNLDGTLKYEEFKKFLKPSTQSIVISQASNVSGIVTDMDFIYRFCLENNLLLIVDGAQAAGCIDVNLNRELPEMIYCFTGHKSLYGPQGTGGMIVLTSKEPKQVFSGGSGFDSFNVKQPNVIPDIFETGTRNVHSIAGLKAGVEYINKKGIQNIQNDLNDKITALYNGLKDLKNIKLYHKFDEFRAPIISFNVDGVSSEDFAQVLLKNGVMTRAGIHCAPLHHKAMDTQSCGMVRLSLSSFNTYEEINKVIKIIEKNRVN